MRRISGTSSRSSLSRSPRPQQLTKSRHHRILASHPKNKRSQAMKAVVFHGIGDVRLDEVAQPKIEKPTDAIVRITAAAICGTDLHFVRGTLGPMKPGTILGHEGIGIVEEVGPAVRNFAPGDRVVIGSTIGCGNCSYCRAGYYANCDVANPNGPDETAFFGGPIESGDRKSTRLNSSHVSISYAVCCLKKKIRAL